MNLAPIVLFVYNRPWHTRETLNALSKNLMVGQSDLIIYADGPKIKATSEEIKNVAEVRKIINEITWAKTIEVKEAETNKGLKVSITDGVKEVINKYGKIIVLEDDIYTSPYFIKYMNDALSLYENDEKVASVNAYLLPLKKKAPDTFFLCCGESWGWGTWKRAWDYYNNNALFLLYEIDSKHLKKSFDFENSYPFYDMLKSQVNGELNTWCIKWYASIFLRKMLTLYPGFSLVKNIGCDGSGTHFIDIDNTFNNSIIEKPLEISKIKIEENHSMRKLYSRFYAKHF